MQQVYSEVAKVSQSGHRSPVSWRTLVPVTVLTFGAACANPSVTDATESPIRFSVSNELLAPVTLAVDGTPHVALLGGGSANVAVPSTAKWLTWTSAKPAGSDRIPIPDDIGEVRVSVASLGTALEISNMIDGQSYFTASVYNSTDTPVTIAVFDGKAVFCASDLPAAVETRAGFTQIGYYKQLPPTEVRAYRGGSDCTGPYVSWPSSQLKAKDKSGWVALTLQAAP